MYINEVNKFKAISMTIRKVNQTIPKKKKNLVQYVDLHQFKKFNIFFFSVHSWCFALKEGNK